MLSWFGFLLFVECVCVDLRLVGFNLLFVSANLFMCVYKNYTCIYIFKLKITFAQFIILKWGCSQLPYGFKLSFVQCAGVSNAK